MPFSKSAASRDPILLLRSFSIEHNTRSASWEKESYRVSELDALPVEHEQLLQIIEISRDGCNLRLGQIMRYRLHDG